jgi:hypothetical protein
MAKKAMGHQEPDAETQKILKDMEDEGEPTTVTPEAEAPVTPPEKETPEAKEVKPVPDTTSIVDLKDEDEIEPGEEDLPDLTRPVQAVPYYKFKKERERRMDLERQLEEAKATTVSPDTANTTSADIDKLAETYSLDKQFVSDLANVLTKSIKPNALDDDTKASLEIIKQQKIAAQEDLGFNNEFNVLAKDYPEVATQKDALHQLAYLDGFNKKSLFEIYFRHLKPKVDPRHTMEPSKGINGEGNLNMDEVANNPEALMNMSDEDFAKYSNQMGKTGKRMLLSSH